MLLSHFLFWILFACQDREFFNGNYGRWTAFALREKKQNNSRITRISLGWQEGTQARKKKVKTKSFLEAKLLATKERRNKSRGVEKQPHYPAPAELSVSVVC
jgi:hypothetical protein